MTLLLVLFLLRVRCQCSSFDVDVFYDDTLYSSYTFLLCLLTTDMYSRLEIRHRIRSMKLPSLPQFPRDCTRTGGYVSRGMKHVDGFGDGEGVGERNKQSKIEGGRGGATKAESAGWNAPRIQRTERHRTRACIGGNGSRKSDSLNKAEPNVWDGYGLQKTDRFARSTRVFWGSGGGGAAT
ncbi:hypothetical protein EDB84DRAFT_773044 [Lactarius hengduanensis]|nr:hypothetical protein EDB84DRAFT_773044 [Lactarius hengduanensis]